LSIVDGSALGVCEELLDEKELHKAKQMIRGNMLISLEETNALALYAGMQELLGNKVDNPDDILKKVEALTVEDVRQVARQILAP
jgi:predicted Zn-dependent peptidase